MSELSSNSLLIQIGQVWWINIRWTDSKETVEKRPAVIVGWSEFSKKDDQVILVSAITSHGDGGTPKIGEIEIPNPESYSLSTNSHIRARSITSIHPSLITSNDGPICTLATSLMVQTLTEISKMFSVQGFAKAR